MDEWKPDLEYIAKLEKTWGNEGYLDQPLPVGLVDDEEKIYVRYFVEAAQKEGWTELGNYLKNNFPFIIINIKIVKHFAK